MPYVNETYANISNRFKDWLTDQSNTGNNVANITKDTLNRAQSKLWLYRAWDDLLKEQDLTLTSNSVALPADFGRVVKVFSDSDNDGKPDTYFYSNGSQDRGYYIRDTFTKAGGHVWTIYFYQSPSSTATLLYVVRLTDFEDSGTEYSFFPGDLVLRQAQLLHLEDSQLTDGNNYTAIKNDFDALMRDYEQAHQFVNEDGSPQTLDTEGQEIITEQYSLDSGGGSSIYDDGHIPSYDRG